MQQSIYIDFRKYLKQKYYVIVCWRKSNIVPNKIFEATYFRFFSHFTKPSRTDIIKTVKLVILRFVHWWHFARFITAHLRGLLSRERGSLVVSCFTKKVHRLFILWPFVTCRPTETRFLSNVYKGMKIYYLDFHVEKYVLFGSISSYDFFSISKITGVAFRN